VNVSIFSVNLVRPGSTRLFLCERQGSAVGEEEEDYLPGMEHEFRLSPVRGSGDTPGDLAATRQEGRRVQYTGAEPCRHGQGRRSDQRLRNYSLLFDTESFSYLYTVVQEIPHVRHCVGWLGSRVVSVLDSGAEGPGFKSQPRRCRVTVLGKLFTPIVPLFIKQQNW